MTETMGFGGLAIAFDDRVLRPRPWTLAQSAWAAELAATVPAGPALELCSGAGHIGLAFAATSGRRLVMVDADPTACRFARGNVASAGLSARVEVRTGDLARALATDERFAVAIADPP
ncbi:MAG: methyltransferase, partial [Nocardioidaceae bacterium]